MVCDGLLVESEDSIGECDQGDACQALELQDDYPAYRAAHGRVIAKGQAENRGKIRRRGLTWVELPRVFTFRAELDSRSAFEFPERLEFLEIGCDDAHLEVAALVCTLP